MRKSDLFGLTVMMTTCDNQLYTTTICAFQLLDFSSLVY